MTIDKTPLTEIKAQLDRIEKLQNIEVKSENHDFKISKEITNLTKALRVAVEALEYYSGSAFADREYHMRLTANSALTKIKEIMWAENG